MYSESGLHRYYLFFKQLLLLELSILKLLKHFPFRIILDLLFSLFVLRLDIQYTCLQIPLPLLQPSNLLCNLFTQRRFFDLLESDVVVFY